MGNVMGRSSVKTSSLIPWKLSTSRTALRPVATLPSACGSPSKRPTITAFSTKVVRRSLNAKPVPLARGSALLDTMVRQNLQPQLKLQPQHPQPLHLHLNAARGVMCVMRTMSAAVITAIKNMENVQCDPPQRTTVGQIFEASFLRFESVTLMFSLSKKIFPINPS